MYLRNWGGCVFFRPYFKRFAVDLNRNGAGAKVANLNCVGFILNLDGDFHAAPFFLCVIALDDSIWRLRPALSQGLRRRPSEGEAPEKVAFCMAIATDTAAAAAFISDSGRQASSWRSGPALTGASFSAVNRTRMSINPHNRINPTKTIPPPIKLINKALFIGSPFYTGGLPCLRAGFWTCLSLMISSALMIFMRVSEGRMISSQKPALAAAYGFRYFSLYS